MLKHAPGPWAAKGMSVLKGDLYICLDVRPGIIIPLHKSVERSKANARLMAAAPDLLAALNAMLEYTAEMNANQGMGDEHPAVTRASAAIAKATGGAA